MKKVLVLVAVATFGLASAASAALTGECYNCHTMHNSEQGQKVAQVGSLTGTTTATTQIAGLLKFDCIACHANSPTGPATWAIDSATIPQVSHGQTFANSLAGGNFKLGDGAPRKAHNVVDLFGVGSENASYTGFQAPPGIYGPTYHDDAVFTVDSANPFDAFTCAGARGCHGTRSQLVAGYTYDNGTDNVYEPVRRTGIAAVSGAHHWNTAGVKDSEGYNDSTLSDDTQIHDGKVVAEGYRFIPGLKGWETSDWLNTDASNHNEYYGQEVGLSTWSAATGGTSGCHRCHAEGHGDEDGTGNYGVNTRASMSSTIRTPNNSMSGFCSTCHGTFHSSGGTPSADIEANGVSGAFLRHPSDYTIPESGEYQYYNTYDISAPVARPTVYAAPSNVVTGDTDLVMCLSCHVPHGSDYDYLLRFDYTTMLAGLAGNEATTSAAGGCLACHTSKGSDPADRVNAY